MISLLALAFLIGMQHATEADHLAAVATLATRQRSLAKTMKQGIAWGIGHTLTLIVFGGTVLVLGKSIPEHMAQALELAVAVMLIALGIDVLRRLRQKRVHFHVHAHEDGVQHVHAHSHAHENAPTGQYRRVHRELMHNHAHHRHLPLRALAVGMMHGMAGSAALILLSLETVNSFSMGLAYILLFGAGSIVGMAVLSLAIAIPLRISAGSLAWLHTGMTAAVGVFSCGLGAFMFYRIGVTEGLLLR